MLTIGCLAATASAWFAWNVLGYLVGTFVVQPIGVEPERATGWWIDAALEVAPYALATAACLVATVVGFWRAAALIATE